MTQKKVVVKPKKVIVDSKGNPKDIVMSIRDYRALLKDLEELESIRAYDKAKAVDDDVIPFEDAIKEIEDKRK
jgi:PHD/YefM family antitoxin component YafN of YafNO toxin-antitoxin module